MLAGLFQGFAEMGSLTNLLLLFAGTALGILVGALPGLSSPMAIIVLLPITFTMETMPAFALMIGIYVGTKLGGSFSAILLRTPGTPASACTALDGYPMAMRGEAGLALGYATMSSTVGGILGWIGAVVAIPLIAGIALYSAPPDIALIGIAGLIMVAAFARGSIVKGLSGVLLGLLVSSVGIDGQDAVMRYTFGLTSLESGIPFAAVLVGIFGFAVVFADISLTVKGSQLLTKDVTLRVPRPGDLFRRWRAWSIGSLYGLVIGAIPGVGADGSTWLSYATVKNSSKNPPPEAFGTGVPEGIITPEASNNATTGGALVPMLTLGIPGDGSTAIMLGAMIMHGLTPGVSLMRDDPDIVYGLLAALLIATIFMFFIAMGAIRAFVFVLQRDRNVLFPFILVFASIGAYSSANSVFPVYVAIIFGIIGFLLEKRGFPVVTIVLGAILGPIIEYNVRLGLALSGGDWMTFVNTWPRICLVAVIALLLAKEIRTALRLRPDTSARSAMTAAKSAD
ncbi:tripartite tricarboxylate transporter permease [Phaeobacter sp. J2-8]|uniref:tripartite tricarboxylate transporter permease n=1 Tax=Phaeobacter sp. J2-8 TaxID=2931394 RepID=UPI001FD408C1|nr:tripartite tricarboxylate transporter permease [Phaeobacter sp. J2-8]MCJ7873502.1 tripartite tricarboxylate transporter permease [Phaeobacter sp. J2-8]